MYAGNINIIIHTCLQAYIMNITLLKLQVQTNGAISLSDDTRMTVRGLIFSFSANADTTGIGNVYYRTTTNQTLLYQAAQTINNIFGETSFIPQYLVVATWFQVGYFERKSDKV